MSSIIDQLLNYPHQVLDFIQANLIWLQLVSAIISALFVWGLVYCIIKSGFHTYQLERWMDILNLKTLPKRRAIIAWRQIQRRLKKGGQTNYKLAILEADKIFDEILKLSGFTGESMNERVRKAEEGEIPNIEKLVQAHRTARKILLDPEFNVDLTLAKETIKIYQDLFYEFGLVS